LELEILYRDTHLIVINKPHGLLVHRSKIAADTEEFALQILRDQIGQRVYTVHRLDRKTSGILVFALSPEVNATLQNQFVTHTISKTYYAIVRGYAPSEGIIDYDLTNDSGKTQNAITHYKTLQTTEIPIAFGKFKTSRYSLVQIQPQTGRFHQIRKHFAHLRHPIIGDRPHGCNKQNKLFKDHWSMITMMLHAREIEFLHPTTNQPITLTAEYHSEFQRTLRLLQFL
jgi:tRNA pseudouridine65 synthase